MDRNEAMDYLQGRIRSYEQKISKLQAQKDAITVVIDRTRTLLNSAKALLRDELLLAGKEGSLEIIETPLSLMTLTDAISKIVNSVDGAIHADLVLKKLLDAGKAPTGKRPKNSVASILNRGVKAGQYRKVGPNLFAPIREHIEKGEP